MLNYVSQHVYTTSILLVHARGVSIKGLSENVNMPHLL